MKVSEEREAATLEVEVKIKARNAKEGKLVDVFDAAAKAIKSKLPEGSITLKDNMEIRIDEFVTEEGASFPAVTARCGSKLTKADAGKI